MPTLYTIGHSTRTLAELIGVLQAHSIHALVDIRSYPASRRLPHFHREVLEQEIPRAGLTYFWEPRLGGRRKKIRSDSPHTALRSDSFRNYADYMLTEEFRNAVSELLSRAEQQRTAIMCAERMYFQCHRMMVSDYVVAHGWEVLHIVDESHVLAHKLMPEARVIDGQLIYNGGQLF